MKGDVQLEFPKERGGGRTYTRECDCRKTSKSVIVMEIMIDERYFGGRCGACGKKIIEKKI